MKRMIVLLTMGFLFSSFTLNAGIDEVASALKTGNVVQLVKYFDNTVDIIMLDKSNSYSKSQAELVLKDFFSSNPVKGFELLHKGENAGSQYGIGNLITRNGNFRTTVYMKQKGAQQFLQEIRFENN